MKEVESQLSAKVENGKIIIEIPIDLLVFAERHRSDSPYIITDEKAMVQYILDHILDFDRDSETGLSKFERMLDGLFDDAYDNAEKWLKADCWDY